MVVIEVREREGAERVASNTVVVVVVAIEAREHMEQRRESTWTTRVCEGDAWLTVRECGPLCVCALCGSDCVLAAGRVCGGRVCEGRVCAGRVCEGRVCAGTRAL